MSVETNPTSRVSGQPISLTSGTLVTSQSGLPVVIQSGAPVSIQSGTYVNIGSGVGVIIAGGTSVSGQPVALVSGTLISSIMSIYSGLSVVTDSGQRVIIQSGAPVSLQSGLPVNIGSGVGVLIQSGIAVNIGSGVGVTASLAWASTNMVSIGSGLGVTASGLNVIAAVTMTSGIGVLVQSQSGATVSVSVSGVTANMASGQALFVQMSGVNAWLSGLYVNTGVASASVSGNVVVIASGISFLMSGASVIATTSGQGYPVIGGQYRPTFVATASGANVIANADIYGNQAVAPGWYNVAFARQLTSGQVGLVSLSVNGGQYVIPESLTVWSGLNVVVQSGVNVVGSVTANISGQALYVQMSGVNQWMSGLNTITFTSGVTANMASGLALYVQMSGVNAWASGIAVNIGSGVGVIVASGVNVLTRDAQTSNITGSIIAVGSSGTQMPNVAGYRHILAQITSSVYWVGATAAAANSGVGFMWQALLPGDPRATLDLVVANLNQIYVKSQVTSGAIMLSHLSFTL